jgi:hypothetical protein
LRVLQDGQVAALGAAAPVQVDLRVLAATQQSIDELVRAGASAPICWAAWAASPSPCRRCASAPRTWAC